MTPESIRAVGLMSGTSGDGVDAALLEVHQPHIRSVPTLLEHTHLPFPLELTQELRSPERLTLPRLAALNFELPQYYAQAVRRLTHWSTATCVGVHGQTIWHAPPSHSPKTPSTLQLGNTSALAIDIGLPVVGDLRSSDIARGGEGAPIVPLCHWHFVPADAGPTQVVNIGGIANYTYVVPRLEDVRASDLGPGMMLIDALAMRASDGELTYDRDGVLSRGGQVIEPLVATVLEHPFFSRPAPRSTGREDFGDAYLNQIIAPWVQRPWADLITSMLHATARAIARATLHEIPPVARVVLTGGGAQHPRLVELVQACLPQHHVQQATTGPLAHHEPASVALIAIRTLLGLPSSLTAVTGAWEPSILGHVVRP